MTTNIFCSRRIGFGLLFLSVLLANTCSAAEVKWSQDIERSLQEATTAGKPVLMEFTASWCVYCKRMEKSTFADAELAARINTQFVPVQVDADKHRDLVKQLEIKGLPAMLIVAPDLTIIDRISGFQTTEALTARLDQVEFKPAAAVDAGTAQVELHSNPSAAGRATVPTQSNPFADPVESVATPAADAGSGGSGTNADAIPRLDLFGDVAAGNSASASGRAEPSPSYVSDPPAKAEPAPLADEPADEGNPFAFAEKQPAPAPAPANPQPAAATSNPFAESEVPAAQNPFAEIEASAAKNPFAEPQSPPVAAPSDRIRSVSRTQPANETDRDPAPSSTAAFLGVCIVTAVEDHEIAAGSAAVHANYRGRILHFRGEAQKAKFLASPDRYWPMLDGMCPVTLGETGKKICGDFQYAAVFRKRIWLFTSEETMRTFLDEPAEAVEEALERL